MIKKSKGFPRPTQAEVKELFDYDPASGLLIRKDIFGCKHPGPLFNLNKDGYLTTCVNGKMYGNHTIIWLHQTGKWPKQLDHKNQCRCDNRMSNLREVTTAQNQRNRIINRKNKSGITGVRRDCSKWMASIGKNNKLYYLGCFEDFDEAVCHRLAAEQCIDSKSYKLNSPAYIYVKKVIQKR